MKKISFIIKQPAFWIALVCLLIIAIDLVGYIPADKLEASIYQMSRQLQEQGQIKAADLKIGDEAREEAFLNTDATLDDLIESVNSLKQNEKEANATLDDSDYYQKFFGHGLAQLNNIDDLEKELLSERNSSLTEKYAIFKEFVTPQEPSIAAIVQASPAIEDLYAHSQLNWVWMSDDYAWSKSDKWILPKEFLSIAPKYKGKPAGDCEDQAHAFTSLLRAADISADNVRVALGLVRLIGSGNEGSDRLGGHAWVEYYMNDQWIALEATNGPAVFDDGTFYDSEQLPLDFFDSYIYPSQGAIAYYNDKYFYNVADPSNEVPQHWNYYSFR